MLDYGALPPEINSGRMYAGPGSAPLMSAAAAWRGLAAELASAASSYTAVISRLSGEEWVGPASASMTAAATPYIEWMNTTAAQAEQSATQATAAAAAFETAHAATVPPPVIAANRTQLAALIATNVLGINTAAIAATEAHYAQMWAQDAAAMYGYAGASAAAAKVTPFNEPNQTTNPAGLSSQAAAVSQAAGTAAGNNAQVAQLISNMPTAIQGLSSPLSAAGSASSPLSGMSGALNVMNQLGSNAFVSSALNGMTSGTATAVSYIPSTLIPNMIGYLTGGGFNAIGGGTMGSGLGALLGPSGPLSSLGALGGGAAASASGVSWTAPSVAASAGQASLVGSSLSVPPSWAAATPGSSAATGALQASGWSAAPESHSMAAMPPGMGGAGGRGSFGFGTPRYGFKPTVMPRPVIAG